MELSSELAFFYQLAKTGSLTATARELNLTPPAVSKRLAQLEARLGVRLLNRTTRKVSLTEEGELYYREAARILSDIEQLEQTVASRRAAPRGLVRLNATFGFGHRYLAPAISRFIRQYPEVRVQLQLTDKPINLADEGYDVGIRLGSLEDASLIARRIARNRQLLVAAPAYLKKNGTPQHPTELNKHDCLVIRENDAYGVWKFTSKSATETVRVSGTLASNNGEVVRNWALEGLGIMLRSEWDLPDHLRRGKLVEILPGWRAPDADIHAVFPQRLHLSAKVRVMIDFLVETFAEPPWVTALPSMGNCKAR
jgi:DNA-binding transcriptional LysR family regulator